MAKRKKYLAANLKTGVKPSPIKNKQTSSWTFCRWLATSFLLLKLLWRRLGRCSSNNWCFNGLGLILLGWEGEQAQRGAWKLIQRRLWKIKSFSSRCNDEAGKIGNTMVRRENRLWGDISFNWPWLGPTMGFRRRGHWVYQGLVWVIYTAGPSTVG